MKSPTFGHKFKYALFGLKHYKHKEKVKNIQIVIRPGIEDSALRLGRVAQATLRVIKKMKLIVLCTSFFVLLTFLQIIGALHIF